MRSVQKQQNVRDYEQLPTEEEGYKAEPSSPSKYRASRRSSFSKRALVMAFGVVAGLLAIYGITK